LSHSGHVSHGIGVVFTINQVASALRVHQLDVEDPVEVRLERANTLTDRQPLDAWRLFESTDRIESKLFASGGSGVVPEKRGGMSDVAAPND
jgi:hypothetical protein